MAANPSSVATAGDSVVVAEKEQDKDHDRLRLVKAGGEDHEMVQSEDAPATTTTANASSLKQEHSVVVPLPTVVEAASPSLDDHNVSD